MHSSIVDSYEARILLHVAELTPSYESRLKYFSIEPVPKTRSAEPIYQVRLVWLYQTDSKSLGRLQDPSPKLRDPVRFLTSCYSPWRQSFRRTEHLQALAFGIDLAKRKLITRSYLSR